MDNFLGYDSVALNESGDALIILDQRFLPNREVFLELRTAEEIFEAIYLLKVRGAPAIGVAAAYGIYVCMQGFEGSVGEFKVFFKSNSSYLLASRPTAVNLKYALDRMWDRLCAVDYITLPQAKTALKVEAEAIKNEDVLMCEAISRYGVELIDECARKNKRGKGEVCILTHCNAGHLAVSRFGTALGPVHLAKELNYNIKVYADETRPLLQGARLTMYELMKHGVDSTLVCDNMVSSLMSRGMIDMVMVGCDRVAANGDVANKIGTSGVAILAKYYAVPFYVLGPSSTIDLECESGDEIIIEQRKPEEVTQMFFKESIAPAGAMVFNPAFDVTKAENITAIITEKGIFKSPYDFKKNLLK